MGKTRVKRSKSRLNKKTRRQRGGWPKWLSCLGGKCNNVTNPMPVATYNPMRNVGTQRRPTGVRRQRANNATTTYNPLRRPANGKHLTASEIEKVEALAAKELAEQTEIANKHAAAIGRGLQLMNPNAAEANAEWAKPSAGQTQAERNAELAENNRKKREATEWPNSPVANQYTPRGTKRQPAKQAAAFNTGGQPDINEAGRNLPAGWHADYDNNGRIRYYFQSSPRSAVTKEQYNRPT